MTTRAFTLIELLVVIAIVGLLLGLLLPALSRASESARAQHCVSNARQISAATSQYMLDHSSVPFYLSSGAAIAFIYGGKTTSHAWGGNYYLTIKDRPLNQYLYPDHVRSDPGAVPDEKRVELPIYECPSDLTSWQHTTHGGDAPESISAYDDVGTSYMLNMTSWVRGIEGFGLILDRYQRLNERMFQRRPSEYIVILDDSASMGLFRRQNLAGDHPGNRHSVTFWDGHAKHLEMDTTQPVGPGWTAVEQY